MSLFILGLIIFFSVHGLSMMPKRKLAFSYAIGGMRNYRLFHGIISILGLCFLAYGWHISPYTELYVPYKASQHIALTVMIFVFIFGTAHFFNGYIKAKLKYPLLIGVKLWAFMHLLSNGDVNSVIFFTLFLLWAGMVRIARKRETAKLANENTPTPKFKNDIFATVIGVLLYGAGVYLHPIIIGVAVLPH